jgi:hypothetical protein
VRGKWSGWGGETSGTRESSVTREAWGEREAVKSEE